MHIDWTQFTPYSALAGGILIGLSAALFALFNGRIAGISGLLGGLLMPVKGEWQWRLAFILSMLATPWLYRLLAPLPAMPIEAGAGTLILAGLLVGIGTRYGAGCTSGHGVCGIARLSPRSILATITFILSGFATVYLIRHLFGLGV
jgi:uncharacterized membrane protein YedE/YeeE